MSQNTENGITEKVLWVICFQIIQNDYERFNEKYIEKR